MNITKFFRVAQSGPTIDGRTISPAQIDQMAANYDPKKYGARVNLEHYLSLFPDSQFKAYGDVLALKAEDGPDGTRVLMAQIDAFPDLVKLKQAGQKVYWSIEINPNFAGTGEAYLAGLASTDTPASLGTEMLTFAAVKSPDKVKTNLYSVAFESSFEMDEQPKDTGPNFVDKVKALFSGQTKATDARFAQTEEAMIAVATELGAIKDKAANFADAAAVKDVADKLAKLSTDLADLTTKLSNTPNTLQRPPVGGADASQTDC
ncbi:MAG: GPO family capsid scaffolding protein [Rhodospirillaceae bacterium]|nr:GPO family capsid scaffolding protein [Rhodospirillales bacterium]